MKIKAYAVNTIFQNADSGFLILRPGVEKIVTTSPDFFRVPPDIGKDHFAKIDAMATPQFKRVVRV